jgi:hypothetical protein
MRAALAEDMVELRVDLPTGVLFDLGLRSALRLAASGHDLEKDVLERTANACWRAITSG